MFLRTRNHRWSTRLVMFGALLCIGGQAASLAHQAAVRHAICATHGELVHDSAADPAAALSPAPWHALAKLPGAVDRHDHCALGCMRRAALVAGERGASLLDAPRGASLPSCEEGISTPALAPLSVAPKSSPPSGLVASLLG